MVGFGCSHADAILRNETKNEFRRLVAFPMSYFTPYITTAVLNDRVQRMFMLSPGYW